MRAFIASCLTALFIWVCFMEVDPLAKGIILTIIGILILLTWGWE